MTEIDLLNEISGSEIYRITSEHFLPSLSIDCVIISYQEKKLKVLLTKYKRTHKWMLPGGFIFLEEDIDDAAERIMKQKTGLEDFYLKQFHLFGECSRINFREAEAFLNSNGISSIQKGKRHWFLDRYSSLAHFAFVKDLSLEAVVNEEEDTEWFDINELPFLFGDHNKIISEAIEYIKKHINLLPIGFELLPERFTMSDLRLVYESFLGYKLDRRNFQRKIITSDYVVKVDEVMKSNGTKTSTLYSFNNEKYNILKETGISLHL